MIYLLDTNICIYFLNGRSERLRQHFAMQTEETIRLCSIVKAELLVGAVRHVNPIKRLTTIQPFVHRFDSLPFDDSAANAYALLRSHLEKQGQPIGPLDMLIAAIALANNATLVTNNTREFSRVQNLLIEDWS
ncbi:MAG: PIN domain-containing protein [Caldilineaceae bacterium]